MLAMCLLPIALETLLCSKFCRHSLPKPILKIRPLRFALNHQGNAMLALL